MNILEQMVVSTWSRDGETAEVVVLPLVGFRAWNITRGRFAVEGLFATLAEVESALLADGWERT